MLELFTIYEHPRDFPEEFVCRRSVLNGQLDWRVDPEPLVRAGSLRDCRRLLCDQRPGLSVVGRMAGDDPVIVEVWL